MDDEEKEERPEKLEFGIKDYVAMFIAALETFLLPMVILVLVIAAVALFLYLRP